VNKTENKGGTSMVELVWKGKQSVEPAHLLYTKFPALHLYTFESHPEHSSSNLTNPSPNLIPSWHNRLILGDKSYILPALLPEFTANVDLISIDPPL
jgi:hypothetical protein